MKDIEIDEASYFPKPQTLWKEMSIEKIYGEEGKKYLRAWTFNGLMVMASVGEYADGKEWLHISVSRESRIPTYEEMTRVKRDFIGDDRKAVFILPEKDNHVNIAENCLHLFYSKENPLPEFSLGGLSN